MIRRWTVLLGTCMVLAGAGAEAQAQPLSLDAAIKPTAVLQARLSPDGAHVAAIVFNGFTSAVVLVKTSDLSSRLLVTGTWGTDGFYTVRKHPRNLHWITPTVLGVNHGPAAEAFNLSGKRVAELGTAVLGKAVPGDAHSPLALIFEDDDRKQFAVVDVSTGKRKALRYPMSGQPMAWAFDERGELRALTLADTSFWLDSTQVTQWYRRADGKWVQVESHPVTQEPWRPIAARAATEELIVAARHERDTSAIFNCNPLERRYTELLAGHPQEDILGVDDPLAATFGSLVTQGLKPQRHWFNARWAGLQQEVDKSLPGRINVLSGDPQGLVLVHAYGDTDPGAWYLLQTATMALTRFLVAQPAIDPEAMRPMETLSYRSRDGLDIPGYLTRPVAGTGPQPLVVMVHGGPWLRDHWQWDAEVQWLATRGYLVFQPQFRGSSGFGQRFEEASYGQWGRAMQDDISDGVKHLISSGVADPQRVFIYGSSCGGYAAVWGLIKTPELYRCGITLAGFSDINEMYSDWSDTNSSGNKAAREIRRARIGDRERDRVRLAEVSPVLRAQDIRVPLLIAHGDADERVPVGHAKRLMRAMDLHKRPCEWLLLKDEGHGMQYVASRKLFLERMLAFIDRHIGHAATEAQAGAGRPAVQPAVQPDRP